MGHLLVQEFFAQQREPVFDGILGSPLDQRGDVFPSPAMLPEGFNQSYIFLRGPELPE